MKKSGSSLPLSSFFVILTPLLILIAQTVIFILQISNCQNSELENPVCWCSKLRYFGLFRLDLANSLNKIRVLLPDIIAFFIAVITYILHRTINALETKKYNLNQKFAEHIQEGIFLKKEDHFGLVESCVVINPHTFKLSDH